LGQHILRRPVLLVGANDDLVLLAGLRVLGGLDLDALDEHVQRVGGVYGILSVGMSLAFGVMRIVNFAHGELVMYGMYAGVVASRNFGIDPLLILPLSILVQRQEKRLLSQIW